MGASKARLRAGTSALAALVLVATFALRAGAQEDVSSGGTVETDLYTNADSPPAALLDGDDSTHFCQHRLLDSDWRVRLRTPARVVRVTVVQGWPDWDQVTGLRLETADGTTRDLTLAPGTRDEQTFDLDFAGATAFVDVRVLAVDDHGDDNSWGGFAELRFDGFPVEPVDTTAPAISNVRVERASDVEATIRWTTDEPSSSQVRFSTETEIPRATAPDPAPVTEHAVHVLGASPLRGYLELRSADAAGNRAEARDATFATVDTAWGWGVGGWSFYLDGRWRPAPEVFAEDGVPHDFVQAWVGGGGWTDWFRSTDVSAMVDAGLVPDVIHYYFGDPVLERVQADRDAFLADIRQLARILADSGVGDRTIVTLEPEFNQDGIPTWDGWNDLAIEAMRILRETAGAKVGLLAGDWDIDHLLTVCMGRAAAYSDFVAFQEMRASTRDTMDDAYDVVDRAVRFSHYLSRTFLRPVRWGYAMVSDYGGWVEAQRLVVAEMCERRPELEANGVVAVSWMSYLDSPGAGGYFDEAEAHKGLRYGSGDGKPAFFVWRECLVDGPTWLSTGEWPAGGGPVRANGCGCRATGEGGAGGWYWMAACAAAVLVVRRRRCFAGAMGKRSLPVRVCVSRHGQAELARATHRVSSPLGGSLLLFGALLLILSASSSPVRAVPGPESVAVVANSALTSSVALAEAYLAARQVPARQLCALDLPDRTDITLDEYRTLVLGPLEACLTAAGAIDRIEAVLLVRGVPLRVAIPVGTETRLVSLAAAVGLWHSGLNDGNPVLGEPPGNLADCGGTPCYAAAWSNPFRRGVFDAGWSADTGRVLWRPLLVTMLHGRSYTDATRLIDSAVEAERLGGAPGEFVFMDGADAARAALDSTYDGAMSALLDRGYTLVSRVAFDPELTGHHLAAFFTGAATLGSTIEGNTYAPGSLADNLTSYGAVPVNFERTGESQVSIARWVALGVAGVHGTTDEPLNNVFPSRMLIVDYVDGSTLAEAFHRRLPYVYWHNLVLGDPMCAPYAARPIVTLAGAVAGETIAGSRRVTAHAVDSTGRGVARIRLFVDGVEAAAADGDTVEACVAVPASVDVQLLAVAQLADDGTAQGAFRPKGWTELRVAGAAGPSDCPGGDADADADADADGGADADLDAAADAEPDAGPDGGAADDGGGCGCRAPGPGVRVGPELLLAGLLLLRRRRAGRSSSARP